MKDWRKAPVEHLVHPFGQGPRYSPVYGGALLPRAPGEAFETGRFHKVPVLQGINRDEQRSMVYGMELAKKQATGDPGATIGAADRRARLEEEFGEEQAAAVAERHPVAAYDDTPALALAAALTDALYARPAVDTGRSLARHVPTYSYEFAEKETRPLRRDDPRLDGLRPAGKAPWKTTTPDAANTQSLASGPGGIHPVDFAEDHQYDFWKSRG